MAVSAFRTGVTQEFFEFIHPADEYAEKLRQQSTALRIAFTLDNLFLLAYSAFFLWFAIERRGKADPLACNVLVGSLLFASLLDAVENFHILSMLNRAELGHLPGDGEIELQYVLSAVKFSAGYFVAVIFGILYPRGHHLLARIVGAFAPPFCFRFSACWSSPRRLPGRTCAVWAGFCSSCSAFS